MKKRNQIPKAKEIAKKAPMGKIDESEESEEALSVSSDNYSSSGAEGKEPLDSAKRLSQKSKQIREERRAKEDVDDDKPSNSLKEPAAPEPSSLELRIFSSIALLGSMVTCYWLGHIYYTFLLIGFGFKTHFELMDLNRNDKHEAKNPTFRIVEWIVPLLTAYYLTPKTFMRRVLVENEGLFDFH